MPRPHPGTHPTRRARRATLLGFTALAAAAALAGLTTAPVDAPRVAHGLLPRTKAPSHLVERRAAARTPDATSTTSVPASSRPAAPPPVETVLHSPVDVPDPSVRLPIAVMGRIQIPKIGLDVELRDQITQESIDLGPSHWPGTATPGSEGNAVIAGHRNSHSAPFHDLGNLAPRDAIVLVDAYGRTFTYAVTEMFVVAPDAMWITEQASGHTLTLFTCHPIGSDAQRLVVRATLL